MKYKFNINDTVQVFYGQVVARGRIIARYHLPVAHTNGYLLKLDTTYYHPIFNCRTEGLSVVEPMLVKI
jgi:hypothetical protein